ncbi:MAG: acyl carrier protein [Lysobacterales bacterium]|nr:MAG: acyl carrier protein [Xanthomonadales bacterium]
MSNQTEQEARLAQLIVETLNLEDIAAAEIDPMTPLFGEGLGLDSIDALELALAISQHYGVQVRTEDDDVEQAFSTLGSLNKFIIDRMP